VRIFVQQHVIWSVNSACHFFGERPFETGDRSTNNRWLALPSFGEAWHNNHHAFPASALHGLTWRQPDLSGLFIRLLAALGAAADVERPAPAALARKVRRPTPEASAG
jgi:stearoyl-CoA desaturase (delta-9 desaturase)